MKISPLCIFTNRAIRKATLFLNHEGGESHNLLDLLWKNSSPVAFVDGFANFVYRSGQHQHFIPDYVTGDFDSILPHVLKYYEAQKSIRVVHTPDQDETDFTKCLRIIINHINQTDAHVDFIVCAHKSGGRLDHEMGLIKTLFFARSLTSIPVLLVTEYDLSLLLSAGEHQIAVGTTSENRHCGLIPIGQPCRATTTGLKWNLNDTVLDFQGLISTSNRILSPVIEVKCDRPLLWVMSHGYSIKAIREGSVA